ncbi:pyridine nucleotide-disulfide oxidoreductase-domain-containing protein [Haematococcus lacustris]
MAFSRLASRGFNALCRSLSASCHALRCYSQTVGTDSIPMKTGRPRLVVLGTGWGGARLLHDIKPQLYDLTVISTRNHMVFTPLLASTTVGTLDPRSVAVHITDIQKALFWPQNSLYIAEATAVLPDKKVVQARSDDGVMFEVAYDKLVVATGSQGSTFGIPGVLEHTHFLRDVHQAESIRLRLVDNIAKAGIPGRPLAEWQRLLHIVIVGGGPTGVEVAGELTDFVNEDLRRLYPDRARAMRITLVEAREVLGSFDPSLREYAARKLVQRGVQLRKGVVKTVTAQEITLTDGSVLPFGLCIWSTGVGPTPFIQSLPFAKTSHGRLAVDSQLRVLAASTAVPDSPPTPTAGSSFVQTATSKQDIKAVNMLTDESRLGKAEAHLVPHVYALGDCCATPENPLPALAQVAEQQGRYLAKELNAQAQATLHAAAKRPAGHQTSTPTPAPAASASASHKSDAFVYKPLGSMATVGGYSAIMELSRKGLAASPLSIAGWVSWFAWRSAYLTRLGSISKRLLVAFNWASTLVFGRDMSRW